MDAAMVTTVAALIFLRSDFTACMVEERTLRLVVCATRVAPLGLRREGMSSCRLGCDLGACGGRPLDDEEFVLPPFLRCRETPVGALPQGAYLLVQLGSRPYGTTARGIGEHADKPTGTH